MGILLPPHPERKSAADRGLPPARGPRLRALLGALLWALLGIGPCAMADEVALTPSLAIKEAYNDNVEFNANHQIADWITTVSPGLSWMQRSGRTDLRLNGFLDLLGYADHDEFNSQGYRADGALRHGLTDRLEVSADGRVISDQEIGDLDPDTGMLTGDADRTRWNTSVGATYRLSEISSGAIRYTHGGEDYDSGRYSDYVRNDVSATYTRDISRIWEATVAQVNAGWARYDYQTSQTETGYLSAGATKALSETFSLTAVLGGRYSRIEYLDLRLVPITFGGLVLGYIPETYEDHDDPWSYIGQLILDHRRETGSERFRVVRDIQAASGRYGTTENTRFSLDLNQRFTDTLTGILAAAYYFNTAESRGIYRRIDEQTLELYPHLRYMWEKDWTFEAGYRYTQEDDDAADKRTTRNQALFLVTYRLPLLE